MSDTTAPKVTAPAAAVKTNKIGRTMDEYKAAESTLCAGCGHNSITTQIIKAYYELGFEPHMVAKMSGIGCSSRTPAFFLGKSHGFNGCHGRMPPVATGAAVANKQLHVIGISGDGDTASIGMSHFVHTVRRNVDMVYIIENNGVYSLTKGQFSATADVGSRLKSGEVNEWDPVDCCGLALEMGCGCVGRSFVGDVKQLAALLKIAMRHRGTSVLDIVSPCVTFNNHEGSTKSYKVAKDGEIPLHEIDFIDHTGKAPPDAFAPPSCTCEKVKLAPGDECEIPMGNGVVRIKKLDADYDPTDRSKAVQVLEKSRREHLFLTGLLYYNKSRPSLRDRCNMVDEPLATLPLERVRPSRKALDEIVSSFA